MSSNMLVLFFVILISAFEAFAQSMSYLSFLNRSVFYFILSWFLYLVIVFLLWKSYHYKGVGYINVLWSGVTTVFMLIIGYMFFGERLSKEEWAGAAFVLFGIGLMTFHNIRNHLK